MQGALKNIWNLPFGTSPGIGNTLCQTVYNPFNNIVDFALKEMRICQKRQVPFSVLTLQFIVFTWELYIFSLDYSLVNKMFALLNEK